MRWCVEHSVYSVTVTRAETGCGVHPVRRQNGRGVKLTLTLHLIISARRATELNTAIILSDKSVFRPSLTAVSGSLTTVFRSSLTTASVQTQPQNSQCSDPASQVSVQTRPHNSFQTQPHNSQCSNPASKQCSDPASQQCSDPASQQCSDPASQPCSDPTSQQSVFKPSLTTASVQTQPHNI